MKDAAGSGVTDFGGLAVEALGGLGATRCIIVLYLWSLTFNCNISTTDTILSSYGGLTTNSFLAKTPSYHSSNHNIEDFDDDHVVSSMSLYYTINELIMFYKENPNALRILSLNCQSLNAKFNQIKCMAELFSSSSVKLHLIILQETWEKNTDNLFHINGYHRIHTEARINKCGGLTIYLHNQFNYSIINYPAISHMYEGLFINVLVPTQRNTNRFIIGNIYRPPREDIIHYEQFTEDICKQIKALPSSKAEIIIAGDFNINLLKINDKTCISDFFDAISSLGFNALINLPTRFNKEKSCSLIDNFYVKNSPFSTDVKSGILISPISDHMAYTLIFKLEISKSDNNNNKNTYFRKQTDDNINLLKEKLININFDEILDLTNNACPNHNYDVFNNLLIKTYEECIPMVKVKFNKYKHRKSDWITKGILTSIKNRDFLLLYTKSVDVTSDSYNVLKLKLKEYNVTLKKVIRAAKRLHYSNYFSKYKGDMKKTWSKINEVLGKKKKEKSFTNKFKTDSGEIIEDSSRICKEMNEYFGTIGQELANSISSPDGKTFKHYMTQNITTLFSFKYINSKDVIETANCLNSKTSTGHDNISTKLLIRIISSIAQPLAIIINQCIMNGVFPDKLKIAKVIPLFKKDDPSKFSNYRPISLLPAISKIFEKVMQHQILNYFDKNNIFYSSQYGFKPEHSCELAALELVDRLHDYIDKNNDPFAIFLDLSKAFDTLDHNILLQKLSFYGFDMTAIKLCESYLKNRQQYVVYDNSSSDIISLDTGVPQGSVLGPLLFIIYTNDLPTVSNKFIPIMYADDTTLVSVRQLFGSQNNIDQQISNELNLYDIWLKTNKLSLNVSKTKMMYFKTPQKKLPPLNINLAGRDIETVKSFNFLGIVLDELLSWNEHVNHIASKLNRANGVLNKIKHFIPKMALINIYHALIGSHINYGLLVWGSNNKRIFKLQKRAIRLINCANYNTEALPLFIKDNILQINDIITLKELIFYYKISNHLVPSFFISFTPVTISSTHDHYTRSTSFVVPFVRKERCRRKLRIKMIKTLNNTPSLLLTNTLSLTLPAFKGMIKKYLIKSYINSVES